LDARGNLSFAEQLNHIPFEIKRTYWIYDVPGGEARGGHAFRQNQEVVIAISGSFDVVVDDGVKKKTFTLNRSYYGLYVPAGLWREMTNFSTNSLALEFGSMHYDVEDYIYDYEEYLQYRKVEELKSSRVQEVQNFKPLEQLEPLKPLKYNVFDCTMVELDRHHSDRKGNLTVVENGQTLPFDVKRVYYLYDVPGGENRGAHAHKELSQLIIAASGSFTVTLDDGKCKRSFFLNRPYQGLYVKPGMWRDLEDFSSGAVCMVLASDVYLASDYIRDYQDFLEFRKN
jgi:oxalate decarboxylase/phosphoglucose isomerase-like protein (cupin superfamily)